MVKVRDSVLVWENLDTHMSLETLDVARFRDKVAAENETQDNHFSSASELKVGDTEWQRKLLINEKNVALWILCCPEDVNARKSRRCQQQNDEVLCGQCESPVCCKCESKWRKGENRKIPMCLGNDNF